MVTYHATVAVGLQQATAYLDFQEATAHLFAVKHLLTLDKEGVGVLGDNIAQADRQA
jgi:hypothetical protein